MLHVWIGKKLRDRYFFVSLGLSIVHVGGSRTSRHRLSRGISAKRIATMYRPA